MRKKEYIKDYKLVEEEKMISISCNKCGNKKELNIKVENSNDEYSINEFQEFNCSFGYGSKYDNERWSFDLCDNCLTELVKSFKQAPEGFGNSGYYATYPEIMFEEWKETGQINIEAGMTKDEIDANGGSVYRKRK
jgi:hypothetical protein